MSTSEIVERRRWRRIVAAVLPEVPDPDAAFDWLWDHFADPSAWRVFSDVELALAGLSELGLAVRVGSNFDARLRRVLAGHGALASLAATAIVSSEVGYRKPHVAFYRAACDALDLVPGRVLFIGDDRANDLDGPSRAGLQAVLLDRRRRDPGAASELTTVVRRLSGDRRA